MKRKGSLQIAYAWVVLLFLFMPTITVVIFSLDSSGRGALPFERPTLHWYRMMLSDPVVLRAFRISGLVAAITVMAAISIGLSASYGMFRRPTRTAQGLVTAAILPLAIPYLVLGISLLSLFRVIGMSLSVFTVSIGHLLITLPIMLLVLNARLEAFDPALEHAAQDLGANPLKTFTRVTFPLIRPSLMGAALLVLAFSLQEFPVTLFTIGAESTVPIVIWGQMRRGLSPTVNAVSTVMFLATIVLVLIARRFSGTTLAAVVGSEGEDR